MTPAERHGGSKTADPVFEAFWDALRESGQATGHDEPAISAPNGTILDMLESADGQYIYDPSAITVPTLVVRGSFDPTATRADALELYDTLGATDDRKTYVEIAGGTHFLHLERRRDVLHDTVRMFQHRYEE